MATILVVLVTFRSGSVVGLMVALGWLSWLMVGLVRWLMVAEVVEVVELVELMVGLVGTDGGSPGEALEADRVRAGQQLGHMLLPVKHACNWF